MKHTLSDLKHWLEVDGWTVVYSLNDRQWHITDSEYHTLSYLQAESGNYILESSDGYITMSYKTVDDLYDAICFVAHCW